MGHWTLDDIPWQRFDRDAVDPEIVPIVKAASLVEFNGAAYAGHLCRIFADDPEFQAAARRWGREEVQHGRALGRWAGLADPEFDLEAAFRRFQAGYQIDFTRTVSCRGSRSGEMVARCMVEVGTSSYYAALRDAVREPVLNAICRNIAADETKCGITSYSTAISTAAWNGSASGSGDGCSSRSSGSAKPRMTNSLTPITRRTRQCVPMIAAAATVLMRAAPMRFAVDGTWCAAWR
jgi:hypothetical protein